MNRAFKIIRLVCLSLILLLTALPQTVLAHASLVQAVPSPDRHLQQSPPEINLTFNERLEKELYYIKVYDPRGQAVTKNAAEMSQDQHALKLALPKLQNGAFTVSYQVISADGHPVRGSYVLTIGERPPGQTPVPHQSLHGEDHGGNANPLPMYITRIIYYVALLLLAGWVIWHSFNRLQTAEIRQDYRTWGIRLQIFHTAALLMMILLQIIDLTVAASNPDIGNLLTGTTVGMSWIFSIILAVGGFFLLFREKWFDLLWVMMLLVAKSINGHAVAFENPLRTVLLDVVHLSAASIWVGGLVFAVVFWKKHREQVLAFLPLFSKWAFISIILLTLSGLFSTLIFLPKLDYLLLTAWGKLLIVKVVLVLLVVVVGAILRVLLRKQHDKTNLLLKIDFGLMLGIVGIVGILTYSNPLPDNEPLYWHQMGSTMHMTTEITPKAPGSNDFSVKIWMPEKGPKPKQLQLLIKNTEKADVAPIEVPLTGAVLQGREVFNGFVEYDYRSTGPYLPFAGDWTVELRVMDSNDNETVYKKDILVY